VSERPLHGRVAIVTGAGRGIGRAIAVALAQAGADVALAGRNPGTLEEVARIARDAHGVRAPVIPTDVLDSAAVDALVQRTLSELGGLHVLVNNSGIYASGSFLEVSQDEFDRVMDTNLRGTALCCRAAGAHLVDQGAGKVINIASIYGERAVVGAAAYCASKAAVLNLTRALALEWARHGVQVNALVPGYVATDMNTAARADPALSEAILRNIPARRFGNAEEVAALAVFLAGSGSGFITGASIAIDGGHLARA
jgi:2-deoxy-D-gluconate 3-dehydrogenase